MEVTMKRVLSVILATLLIVSVFPLSIFAESSNGFRTNFQLTKLDEKWNTKEDGTGEDYDLLSLDYQLKGEGISGAQGAWIAIDLTKLIVVYYSNGWSILDYISEGIVVPGEPSVEVEDENFYVLKKKEGSGLNVTDQWKFGENSNYFALSEDGNTLYLGTQPTQSKSVTYDLFTTVVSFRLAVRPGAELAGDSVRYINEEERDILNQSFIILMNDGTNEYSYGDIDGEDDLVIDDFSGDSGISGRPTVHAQAPTFTTIPQNADFYIGDEATLTAVATVEDGGTVSYEWFKNTESSNEGGESVGTGDKLTIPTEAELDAYYYVVATNTNESETINGNKTASTASDAVHVTVSKHPHTIALEEAVAALEAITWEDIAQADANTEDAVRAYLGAIADAAVNNADVTVEVTISDFTAAVEGSAATTHEGVDGAAKFAVRATIGEESYMLDNQSVKIIATYFGDKLHGEILDEAVAALETITWGDVAQEDANTEAAVRAYLEEIVKTAVGCDDVAVNVSIERFEAAVAGSAATTHEGTDGYAIFTVTLSIGEESYTTEVLDVSITATYYSDMTHEEMIDEAVYALETITWADIAEEDANTEEAVRAYLKAIADAAVNNAEITIEVKFSDFTAAVAGSAATTHEGTNGAVTFTVSASVGEETYITDEITVAIIATYFDGKLHSEIIDEAKAALEGIVWEDIAQKTANEQDTVAALLKKIAEDAIANEDVEVIILIDTFVPAVAGSADTSHEGTDGEVEFFAKAVIGKEIYTLPRQEVAIIATYYSGQLDTEAVEDAVAKLDAITWEDIAQETANTEEDVKAYIEAIAKAAVGNDNVTLEVEIIDGDAAVAGSAATTHEGENGFVVFRIKATCGEVVDYADSDEFDIIATYFDGVLDKDAIASAKRLLDGVIWEYISQSEANTEEDVKAYLEAVASEIIGNDKAVVEVKIDEFKAAVAGSAATSHDGENGYAKFTVKVTVGSESYSVNEQEVAILATIFEGLLDSEAVEDAFDKTVGGEVVVKIRATEEEIEEAVADYVRTLLTGDAEGVSVSVSLESGSTFRVTLTKGDASAEKIIEMTITEEDPIKLPAPTGLSFNRGIAAWSKVENASGYVVNLYSIKGDTVTLLMTVEADTNKYDFTADIKDNVSYFFDVTAKGDGVFFLDSDTSEDSDVYKNQRNDIVDQILADMLAMRNRRFNITAIAGVGGSISDEGVSRVKFGTSKTYTITANEGYEIVSVIVDGRDVGAISEYKFKDVRAKHTIEVIFAESAWENPFVDIYETDTYYEAIEFVYENGLFKGTSETEFEPATTMTRAMFVTVLWRLHGEPVVNYLMQFDDVEADTWYTEAVRWASAEGIVNGYGDGLFGVDDEITVEQAAVIIARYAKYCDEYVATFVDLEDYTDGGDVSDWAAEQMMWALENGIYESVGGKLDPQAAAPRSLVAEMFHRYVVKFVK